MSSPSIPERSGPDRSGPDRSQGFDPKKFEAVEKELEAVVQKGLREHWKWFTAEGVLLVLLGAAAIAVPVLASIAVAAFVGWLLFFAGVFSAISTIRSPRAPGYVWHILLSALMAILGLVLALFPVQGSLSLTLVMTAYFIAHGIATVAFAFSIKPDTGRWIGLLFVALVDFVIAALVIAGWPSTGLWVLGLFVGIELLLTGFGLIFAALGARERGADETLPDAGAHRPA
jgi:uncharacterized membrane protein HdeD (DUF308 family)